MMKPQGAETKWNYSMKSHSYYSKLHVLKLIKII
jgi:hypothetical protein